MTLLFYTVIDILSVVFLYFQEKFNNGRRLHFTFNPFCVNKSDMFGIISYLLLVCVIIFRDGVGTDYSSYASIYLDIAKENLLDIERAWLAPGFLFICRILGYIDPMNYYLMFAFFGILSISYIYKSIYTMSSSIYLSLYLFLCSCLYYQMFNQFRQMLAISITLYALSYLLERKRGMFSFYVFLATMIHQSAVVFYILLVVRDIKFSYKLFGVYAIISILGFFYFDNLMMLIKDESNYGAVYVGSTLYDVAYSGSVIVNTFVRIFILLLCMLVYNDTVNRAKYTVYLYNVAWICTVIQIFTLQSYLFGRVTTYFFVPYIILLPEVLKTYEIKLGKYGICARIFFFICFAIYHYGYYLLGGASGSGYDEYKLIDF